MTRLALLTIAVPLVAACAAAAPAPAANGAVPATETAAPEIPLRVRWSVVSDAGGRLVVDAVVLRRAQLRFPVSIRVQIPAGLTLMSGPAKFEVPVDGQTGESVTRLEFSYQGAPPSGDLELVGDAVDRASASTPLTRIASAARSTSSDPSRPDPTSRSATRT